MIVFPHLSDGETVFFLLAVIAAVLLVGVLLIWLDSQKSHYGDREDV